MSAEQIDPQPGSIRRLEVSELSFETRRALILLQDALRREATREGAGFSGAQVTFDMVRYLDEPPTVDVRVVG